jgi:hypothetical protein
VISKGTQVAPYGILVVIRLIDSFAGIFYGAVYLFAD